MVFRHRLAFRKPGSLGRIYWDDVAKRRVNHYVDFFSAGIKRNAYTSLIERWTSGKAGLTFKTDLFEEAFGDDHLLSHLADKGAMAVGCDISHVVCTRARERMAGISVDIGKMLVADVSEIPVKSGCVDLVVSSSTLDHLPEIDQALAEIHRILSPQGVLILTLNNAHNPLFVMGTHLQSFFGRIDFYIDKFYSEGEMKSLLGKAGFRVDDVAFIVHIPFGLPTVFEHLGGFSSDRVRAFKVGIARLIQQYSLRKSRLHRFTGWYVALCALKE